MTHCLPKAGGLFDQDALVVHLMQSVLLANAEKRKLEQARKELNQSGPGNSRDPTNHPRTR